MKLNIHTIIIAAIAFLGMSGIAKAQQKELLSFDEYLSMVGKKNLTYAAQKYNVSMAEASIQTANMFPIHNWIWRVPTMEFPKIWVIPMAVH